LRTRNRRWNGDALAAASIGDLQASCHASQQLCRSSWHTVEDALFVRLSEHRPETTTRTGDADRRHGTVAVFERAQIGADRKSGSGFGAELAVHGHAKSRELEYFNVKS